MICTDDDRLLGIGGDSTRRRSLNFAVCRAVERREGKVDTTVQELGEDEGLLKNGHGIYQVDSKPAYTCPSALLKEHFDGGQLLSSHARSKERLLMNVSNPETTPIDTPLFLDRSSAPAFWPVCVPSNFDTTDSSELLVSSESQKSLLNQGDLVEKHSDKLGLGNEIKMARNDLFKMEKRIVLNNDSSTRLYESRAKRNSQGVCARSEAGDISQISVSEKKMFSKDQTNKMFINRSNGALCTENGNNERKFKNVGTTCNIPATVFRNVRISQFEADTLLTGYKVGNTYNTTDLDYNEREFESLKSIEVIRQKSSPLKRVSGEHRADNLNGWISSDGQPYTFIERYADPEEDFKTLCSFCSDVDGSFYENIPKNVIGSDRFFRCRPTARGAMIVQPLLTTPSDDVCDLPVSFVTTEEPSLSSVQQDNPSQIKSPAVLKKEGIAYCSRNRKVSRLQPRFNERSETTAKARGSACNPRKTQAFVFGKRQNMSTVNCGRSRPSMTKRSMTAHDVRGRKELDYSLQPTFPRHKRQLRTSPEKL